MQRTSMSRRVTGWILFCSIGLSGAIAHADLQRVNVGVFGGQVKDIAAYNASGQTALLIAVECNRGIFRWDAAATEWETVTYPELPGKGLALECNRQTGYENDLYAILQPYDAGAFLCGSDTGGLAGTWVALTNSGISNPSVLVGHSSGFYVGTYDGRIMRNTGGITDPFTEVYRHPSFTQIMSVSPFSSGLLFGSVSPNPGQTNIFRLDWNGSAFIKTDLVLPTSTGSGSADVRVRIVGVSPSDSNELYMAGNASEIQVYHSTDGGLTWPDKWYNFNASGTFPGGYPNYIKFDNGRVFISHSTRNALGVWTGAVNAVTEVSPGFTISTHLNDAALEPDPLDPTHLYLDTDWAIAKSPCSLAGDWGAGTEVGTNKGIQGVVLNDMDFYSYSPSNKVLWIAAKSGVGRTLHFNPLDPSTTATPGDWLFPLWAGSPAHAIAIQPTNPAVVLAGYNSGHVTRTEQGEETNAALIGWTQVFYAGDHPDVFGTAQNEVRISALEFVPSRPDEMYLAGFKWQPPLTNGGVFFSDDGGRTWTNDYGRAPVNTLMVMDNAVWAGIGSEESPETGLRAKIGLGSWWKPLTHLNLDDQIVTDISGAQYGRDMIVYAVTGVGSHTGGVYKGVNTNLAAGGFSNWIWTDVTANIPAPVPSAFSAVTLDPANPDRAFVARDNCIYETYDGGATWSLMSGTGLPSHEDVRVLAYDDLMGGTGDGLYSYLYSGSCLEMNWTGETGVAYRITAGPSPNGPFNPINWSGPLSATGERSASITELPADNPLFLRVTGDGGFEPAINTFRIKEP